MHAAVISLILAAAAGAADEPSATPAPAAPPPAAEAVREAQPPGPALQRAQPDAALAFGAKDVPLEILEQALAPAPKVVVLKTAYYGTITVNHAAHLARKIHCIECHGQGPVTKIAFTPKEAHARCRDCHAQAQRGPTECRGCHNMVAPGTVVTGLRAIGAPQVSAAEARAAVQAKEAVEARRYAKAGALPTEAELHTFVEPGAKAPVFRTFQAGGAAGDGDRYGFSVRVASRQDWLAISHNLDRMTGPGHARTLLYSGGGYYHALPAIPSLGLIAEALGGIDTVQKPKVTFAAAVGARLGVEWDPPWAPRFPITLSVAGFADIFHGEPISPACAYVTLGVGAPVSAN